MALDRTAQLVVDRVDHESDNTACAKDLIAHRGRKRGPVVAELALV